MAAQGLEMLSGVDREHLLQYVSGRPVGHQGREMRLKPVQLRYRSAIRWPSNPSLDPARRGTAQTGKPNRNLAEQRRYRMIPAVLRAANIATACAVRSPNGVLLGLCGDDLPLKARKQPFRFGENLPNWPPHPQSCDSLEMAAGDRAVGNGPCCATTWAKNPWFLP